MIRPRVVVFDLGKVLLDFDYGIVAPKIAARSNTSAAEVNRILNQSPLLHRYETGLMSSGEFYAEVRSATGFQGDMEEFRGFFSDIFSPIDEMVEIHSTLRKQEVFTVVLSNTNDLAISHIRERYTFYGLFDAYVLSYQHGAMKPDARLYEVVERETRCKRDTILYLDDRADNIATGAARGWRVILHETPAKTRVALKGHGLLE